MMFALSSSSHHSAMNSDESSRSEVTFHEGYADSGDLTIIAKDDIAFRIQKFYLQAAR